MAIQWRDTPNRFGAISRGLHWGMAALFGWQFLGMGFEALAGETPLARTLNSQHFAIGTLILLLALVRLFWGLANRTRRPDHGASLLGRLATLGQGALYALMLIVPGLALLRAYGSGRGFSPFGLPLFPATGERIDWMMAPAHALHGPLAWTLLALIAGHVTMALVHRFLLRDGTFARMTAGRQGLANRDLPLCRASTAITGALPQPPRPRASAQAHR